MSEAEGVRARVAWALAGLAAAVVPCAIMWGFSIDDALISVRYARHLASGAGYVWNVGGPATDGVTPLPWSFLLAPLARAPASALSVLIRAKCMGFVAWAATAVWLGMAVGRLKIGIWAKGASLLTVAVSLPVAAHAVSGMETGLTIACATMAALCVGAHPRACAVLAGIAAAFRPEMAPWAVVLALGAGAAPIPKANANDAKIVRALVHAGIALVPFLACVLVRIIVFGRPAPLSVLAKPSDVLHGVIYALPALVVAATPILVFAPIALARGPREARIIVVAAMVHVLSVIAVGGDWMPYARLVAPIAPSLAFAHALCHALWRPGAHRVLAAAARWSLALVAGAVIFARAAPAGRTVLEDRRALIERARPHLADASSVAALDIGWVSAATEATVIDLAGVTDPETAVLAGDHTSKRIDAPLLLSKNPDVLLFRIQSGVDAGSLSGWQSARYAYLVEARLARSDLIAAHFAPEVFLPLSPLPDGRGTEAIGQKGAGYVLLRRVK